MLLTFQLIVLMMLSSFTKTFYYTDHWSPPVTLSQGGGVREALISILFYFIVLHENIHYWYFEVLCAYYVEY